MKNHPAQEDRGFPISVAFLTLRCWPGLQHHTEQAQRWQTPFPVPRPKGNAFFEFLLNAVFVGGFFISLTKIPSLLILLRNIIAFFFIHRNHYQLFLL